MKQGMSQGVAEPLCAVLNSMPDTIASPTPIAGTTFAIVHVTYNAGDPRYNMSCTIRTINDLRIYLNARWDRESRREMAAEKSAHGRRRANG